MVEPVVVYCKETVRPVAAGAGAPYDAGMLVFDLIAAQPEGTSPVSGGGEYTRRVFARLVERIGDLPGENSTVSAGAPATGAASTHGGAASDRRDHPLPGVAAVCLADRPIDEELVAACDRAGIPLHRVASAAEVGPLLRREGATRFFSALPLRYARFGPGFIPEDCEFVYTIHGLRPLELPWDSDELRYATTLRALGRHLAARWGGRRYLRRRRAQFEALFSMAAHRRIVTDSRHSQYALLSHFPQLTAADIELYFAPAAPLPSPVTPDQLASRLSAIREHALGDAPPLQSDGYYLIITANRWGKNGARTVDALRRLYGNGAITRPTVLVGVRSHGRLPPYLRRLPRTPEAWHFVLLDYVSRTDLDTLYQGAFAFLFLTLNEGFGYPPLECMSLGTPVLASAVNSIPELVGDGALLCNPWATDEIASRILELDHDAVTRDRLRTEGPRRAAAIRIEQERMLNELVQTLLSRAAP